MIDKHTNIILVGLMGAGKTTVGKLLARHLDKSFYDSDHELVRRNGVTIPVIFEVEGEAGFRRREEAVIDELTQSGACVLSTGGGVILRQANRDYLRQRTQAVYLHSAPEEVFRRLRNDQNRPLLQVSDPLVRLKELYFARDPLYRETAHFVVETGRPSVSTLVNIILMQLELAGGLAAL